MIQLITCHWKDGDQTVRQGQVEEEQGASLPPHPLPQECVDSKSVANDRHHHQTCK